ncbi:tRNA (guanosine(18)-2'-O)-methyltransferase [Trichoplax sp. H2]|nr:tRNA (guanosine(18)-2'-O)-methyltransferase [Trichoplax sp. H2]|eukprot:RDD38640.1 tRNA (guanosine(18)-2'-O)-methyltransferase [Trichoplax sp. H2]
MSYFSLWRRYTKAKDMLTVVTSKSTIEDFGTLTNNASYNKELLQKLTCAFTKERLDKMTNAVKNRTRSIAVVLEGITNEGNEQAIYRTMDALGFQTAHRIPSPLYRLKTCGRTDAGAMKWIDIESWKSTEECISQLKSCGYKILATSSENKTKTLDSFDFSNKTAVVLGSEQEGISKEAMNLVDNVFRISMVGFVESYNVSVAAAIILYHIYQDRIRKLGYHGDLTEAEQDDLLLQYMLKEYGIKL